MRRMAVLAGLSIGALLVPISPVTADDGADRPAPSGAISPGLHGKTGPVEVVVRLSTAPVADVIASGGSGTDELAREASIESQQNSVSATAAQLGATELGRVDQALNAVMVQIDASQLQSLAAVPGVVSVKPVHTYSLDVSAVGSGSLEQAVEYLGASGLRGSGVDGTGVKVAVLDSGVDFTHRNLGGPGTIESYNECYFGDPTGLTDNHAYDAAPVGACADLFGSTAPKVKGGFDFVGEVWPVGARSEDPNPIDFEGHGTHVSDIIGGKSADGLHTGIAPGVDLYGVRVCSAVATSCDGVALLNAVDWAIANGMDLVNLSLGSDYGQEEDDLSSALEGAVRAGIVVVASAGNGGDLPFKVGSPSTASGVISVAQTALPDDKLYPVVVAGGPTINNAVYQTWSPLPATAIVATLAAPAVATGCTPADVGPGVLGRIAVIARGVCSVTLKVDAARQQGAVGVIIYNNRAGAPPSFSYGGGDPSVPTVVVSDESGVALLAVLGQTASMFDPNQAISLTNTMVGTSSRGPEVDGGFIKPDIGAPGAWLSAEVGTGDAETSFGGTSGAAPTVSGSAALVMQVLPGAGPREIKARLLNGADTANRTPDALATDFYLTPISRIGAGEVRPGASLGGIVLGSDDADGGNISFQLPRVTKVTTLTRTVTLTNTSSERRTISLGVAFRDAADQASGAVRISVPSSVRLAAGQARSVQVRLTIDPAKLADWPLTGLAGVTGNDGTVLNDPEFDGWLTVSSGSDIAHLGWHVLPHKSADVRAARRAELNKPNDLELENESKVVGGGVEVFTLIGTDPQDQIVGAPGSNTFAPDLKSAGARVNGTDLEVAVASFGRNAVTTYPQENDVYFDIDQDGAPEFVAFTAELGLAFGADGRGVVYLLNLTTGVLEAVSFVDADYDSSVMIISVPSDAIGYSGADIDIYVNSCDNYFTGNCTDEIAGTFAGQFTVSGGPTIVVPAGKKSKVTVSAIGVPATDGMLLVYRDAVNTESQVVTVR